MSRHRNTGEPHSSIEQLDRAVRAIPLASGARILVAVSGGPDSVALLDSLYRSDCEWQLRVAHVNHGLRGKDADEDEAFVRSLAAERGLSVDVVQVDTAAYARAQRLSIETAARLLRWCGLRGLLHNWPGDVIATGHTQNDQAETVIMRWLRGAGLTGLGGMHYRTADVIRPLLGLDHDVILAALERRGLPCRLDASNHDPAHQRNRVRHEVLPVLRGLVPRAVENIARSAQLLQLDADLMRHEVRATLEVMDLTVEEGLVSANVGIWRSLHQSLQLHTLRALITLLLGDVMNVEERHLNALAEALRTGSAGPSSGLPRGLHLSHLGDRFALTTSFPRLQPVGFTVSLAVPGTVDVPSGSISAAILTTGETAEVARLLAVCGPLHALCDGERLGNDLVVRARQPGDRLRPLGAPGTRKLQDILIDAHVPRHLRDDIPVLRDGDEIVWVPGVALGHRYAISGATRRIVHLRFQRLSNGSHAKITMP